MLSPAASDGSPGTEPVCVRCAGPHHSFACVLIGLGPTFKANQATECALATHCFSPDGPTFNADGPYRERDTILSLGDMGYVHACCAVQLLQPYREVEQTQTIEQRVHDLAQGKPPSIQEVMCRASHDAASPRALVLTSRCDASSRFRRCPVCRRSRI